MTRRDYELLAAVIASHWVPALGSRRDAVAALANDLAGELAADNPCFDRHRFIAAALPVQ